MFLSGDLITEHGKAWITPFHPDRVDGAAYTMRIGDEAFVSPEGRDTRTSGLFKLEHNAPLAIPPGQFAYLTTREFVTIPHDFLCFINMKNSLKKSGLVNVSGFHVDPGYKGKLLFAVFNAGPQTVTVRCNQPAFLIWFARLDRATTSFSRTKSGFKEIDTELMGLIPSETASLNTLKSQIDSLDRKINNVYATLAILSVLATGALSTILADMFLNP